jgi:hypothetical protein
MCCVQCAAPTAVLPVRVQVFMPVRMGCCAAPSATIGETQQVSLSVASSLVPASVYGSVCTGWAVCCVFFLAAAAQACTVLRHTFSVCQLRADLSEKPVTGCKAGCWASWASQLSDSCSASILQSDSLGPYRPLGVTVVCVGQRFLGPGGLV